MFASLCGTAAVFIPNIISASVLRLTECHSFLHLVRPHLIPVTVRVQKPRFLPPYSRGVRQRPQLLCLGFRGEKLLLVLGGRVMDLRRAVPIALECVSLCPGFGWPLPDSP